MSYCIKLYYVSNIVQFQLVIFFLSKNFVYNQYLHQVILTFDIVYYLKLLKLFHWALMIDVFSLMFSIVYVILQNNFQLFVLVQLSIMNKIYQNCLYIKKKVICLLQKILYRLILKLLLIMYIDQFELDQVLIIVQPQFQLLVFSIHKLLHIHVIFELLQIND